MDITTTPAWSAALKSAAAISQTTLKDLFAQDSTRAETLSVEVSVGKDTMLVDFSKQNIDDTLKFFTCCSGNATSSNRLGEFVHMRSNTQNFFHHVNAIYID